MLVIGEKINVMSKTIGPAIKERDPVPIREAATEQAEAGAEMLDLNLGPATRGGPEMMEWLVNTVQDAVDVRLCLDTTNVEAIEAGLRACRKRPMINSTSAERARLERLMPLAAQYEADIIGLAMTEAGVSRDCGERVAAAAEIMAAAQEFGVPLDRVYLDPLLLPVCVAQQQATEALEAIRLFKQLSEPQMKTVVGLSNIYNGCPPEVRTPLAAAYAVMLAQAGLDAMIADPLDEGLTAALKSMRILSNETLYCHSYLQ
ncbi:MAG: dihydropteroate synthase [Coriobacteriia bacterium]|nr:dihydropteroate synthase [Coriobacteriia bacterium]